VTPWSHANEQEMQVRGLEAMAFCFSDCAVTERLGTSRLNALRVTEVLDKGGTSEDAVSVQFRS
jgi:hypothetical protein